MTQTKKNCKSVYDRALDSHLSPFVKTKPSPDHLVKITKSYRLLNEEQRIKDSGYVPEFLPPEVPYTPEPSGRRRAQPLSLEGQILQCLERLAQAEAEAVAQEEFRQKQEEWWQDYQLDNAAIQPEPLPKYRMVVSEESKAEAKRLTDQKIQQQIDDDALMSDDENSEIFSHMQKFESRTAMDGLVFKMLYEKYGKGQRYDKFKDQLWVFHGMTMHRKHTPKWVWAEYFKEHGGETYGMPTENPVEYHNGMDLSKIEVSNGEYYFNREDNDPYEDDPYRGSYWYMNAVYGDTSMMGGGSKRIFRYSILTQKFFAESMTLVHEKEMWINHNMLPVSWEPKDAMRLWWSATHDRSRKAVEPQEDWRNPVFAWLDT
ncbi:MAG: hypothetical protein EOM68_27795, partial [Spirochaetia bacterium]|nr:hypothetical protein [Spirochaetia bacterium]